MILPERKVHLNKFQLQNRAIQANVAISVVGRGGGKSHDLGGHAQLCIDQMPQGLTMLLTPTYKKLLGETLPSIINGLAAFGKYEGVHYFVGRYADPELGWPRPILEPKNNKDIIHCHTGHTFRFVSQDIKGGANGLSTDGIIADELRFINKQQMDTEAIPTLRGNVHRFKHVGIHHGFKGCTDMPRKASEMWIFDYEKEVDQERLDMIYSLQMEQYKLIRKVNDPKLKTTTRGQYRSHILKIAEQLAFLRKGDQSNLDERLNVPPATSFVMASAMDNIDILGAAYFHRMKRMLSDHVFRTSILNERNVQAESRFYPSFEPEWHSYRMESPSYVKDIDYTDRPWQDHAVDDCRSDADFNEYQPLYLAPDYGKDFNCLIVGQRTPSEVRALKDFWRKRPDKVRDLVQDFCDYYRFSKRKHVHLISDHTARGGHGVDDGTYEKEWTRVLQENGWSVEIKNIGRARGHHHKYEFIDSILTESDPGLPKFRYNRDNCDDMATALELAAVKKTGKGEMKKDKSSERKPGISREKATDLTDAFDTLLIGIYEQLMDQTKAEYWV